MADSEEVDIQHGCFVGVATFSSVKSVFDYLPPEHENHRLSPGVRVLVPFGRRLIVALVVRISQNTDVPYEKLKCIKEVLDEKPLVDPMMMELYQWVSVYYHCGIGQTLTQVLPKHLRSVKPYKRQVTYHWLLVTMENEHRDKLLRRSSEQRRVISCFKKYKYLDRTILRKEGISRSTLTQLLKKELVTQVRVERERFSILKDFLQETPLQLSNAQSCVYQDILLGLGTFKVFLLEGITGSGKTEVYLQVVEQVLKKGKQVLVLVPEIGLAPQTVRRFQRRFNVLVVCLHSGLNDTERLNGWLDALDGYAGIVIATRSGVFVPMSKLGLIVVDEEHDTSYKQETSFCYNARDVAVYRAKKNQCPVVLGSATPSLETVYNSIVGKYAHLKLMERAGEAKSPSIVLMDVKQEKLNNGMSEKILENIECFLESGSQVMVFLNRRGYASSVLCHDCGKVIECPSCDAYLVLHKYPPRLQCHHCDYQCSIPLNCEKCNSGNLLPMGQGTENIEQVLKGLFPKFFVFRIDRDSTRKKNSFVDMMDKIKSGIPSILLGTQMLAKGHHFPNLSLVVVLDVDAGLYNTDFRASERTGQLIVQVAGRAGREEKAGQVIIQTCNPNNILLKMIISEKYMSFVDMLLKERQKLGVPPYAKLALIRTQSDNKRECENFLKSCKQYIGVLLNKDTQCFGPIPAIIEKKGGVYRWNLIFQAKCAKELHNILSLLTSYAETLKLRKLRFYIDVDPQDFN